MRTCVFIMIFVFSIILNIQSKAIANSNYSNENNQGLSGRIGLYLIGVDAICVINK